MSTRSSITVKHSDGKYHSVYCHFDGYPEHVGVLLVEHYASQECAEALVALGGLSSLGESIECPPGHSYDSPANGCSVFYHRDRGEPWDHNQTIVTDTYEAALERNSQAYDYLWDGERWLVGSKYDMETRPVAVVLEDA